MPGRFRFKRQFKEHYQLFLQNFKNMCCVIICKTMPAVTSEQKDKPKQARDSSLLYLVTRISLT
jgi:hypothetical protein